MKRALLHKTKQREALEHVRFGIVLAVFLNLRTMLINKANNDQNIDRVCPKMSDGLSGQNHHHNAKLLCDSQNISYFTEADLNNAEDAIVLNNSYDHMYATNSGNGDVNELGPNCQSQSAESEVKFLKDWLILHLDLIQQQNDEILNKEKTILILQQENEMVRRLC